jgi:hypothetical protein
MGALTHPEHGPPVRAQTNTRAIPATPHTSTGDSPLQPPFPETWLD